MLHRVSRDGALGKARRWGSPTLQPTMKKRATLPPFIHVDVSGINPFGIGLFGKVNAPDPHPRRTRRKRRAAAKRRRNSRN